MAEEPNISIGIEFIDNFSNTIKDMNGQLKQSFEDTNKYVAALGAAMTGFGLKLGGSLLDSATKFAELSDAQEAYNKVVGESSGTFEELDKATLNSISKVKLYGLATTSVSKGLDANLLPAIAGVAQQLADSDPAYADVLANIEAITSATISGRDVMIKQMGLQVDFGKAQEDYAKKLGLVKEGTSEVATKEAIAAKEKISQLATSKEALSLQAQEISLSDMSTASKKNQTDAIKKQTLDINKQIAALKIVSAQTEKVEGVGDASKLTDQQKAMANQLNVQDAIAQKSKELPQATIDSADAMNQFKRSIDDLSLSIGEAVDKYFTPLIETVTQVVKWFTDLNEKTGGTVGIVLMVVAALALIAGPLLFLVATLPLLIAGFGTLSAVTLPITGTILLIAGGIALLIAGIVLLVKHWDFVKEKAMVVWNFIKEMIGIAIDFIIKNYIDPFINAIQKVIDLWDKLKKAVGSKIDAVVNMITGGSKDTKGTKKNDFLMRPGQEAVSFSPDDTIIGVKKPSDLGGSGGGVNVSIGNIYGVDAHEISREFSRELTRAVKI